MMSTRRFGGRWLTTTSWVSSPSLVVNLTSYVASTPRAASSRKSWTSVSRPASAAAAGSGRRADRRRSGRHCTTGSGWRVPGQRRGRQQSDQRAPSEGTEPCSLDWRAGVIRPAAYHPGVSERDAATEPDAAAKQSMARSAMLSVAVGLAVCAAMAALVYSFIAIPVYLLAQIDPRRPRPAVPPRRLPAVGAAARRRGRVGVRRPGPRLVPAGRPVPAASLVRPVRFSGHPIA